MINRPRSAAGCALHVRLTRGDLAMVYEILPGEGWSAQARIVNNGARLFDQALHGQDEIERILVEFIAEIAWLQADGWQRDP